MLIKKAKGTVFSRDRRPELFRPASRPKVRWLVKQGLQPGLADNIDDPGCRPNHRPDYGLGETQPAIFEPDTLIRAHPNLKQQGGNGYAQIWPEPLLSRDRCRIVHDVGRLSLCKTCPGILQRSGGGIGATDKFSSVSHSAIRSRARAIHYLTLPSTTAI